MRDRKTDQERKGAQRERRVHARGKERQYRLLLARAHALRDQHLDRAQQPEAETDHRPKRDAAEAHARE